MYKQMIPAEVFARRVWPGKPQLISVRPAQTDGGARASARFSVHYGTAHKTPSPPVFSKVKRRERRVPSQIAHQAPPRAVAGRFD